jgi:hypothetical protein
MMAEINKYTFTHEFESDITGAKMKMIYESESTTWSDLIAEFTDFLRGCGFKIDDEEL